MIALSEDVQNDLNQILETYSGVRLANENGPSAFQNWWWQIQNYIQDLDVSQANVKDGIGLIYEMPYWGEIRFSKYTIGDEIGILVTNITFNKENFFQFLKYHRCSQDGQPVIVGDLNYGYKLIKQQNGRLYGIMNPYDEIIIKPYYDRIIPFHHCEENQNKRHAIGVKRGRCYAIYLDGDTEVLSMNASELRSIGCRHFRNLGEEACKRKIVVLTENQFQQMLIECVVKIIKEIT